ncbi:hypothetical protein [Caulobacter segnis]|uniref:Uncharacterized protein n=1 Tax=Caulobacter segnis TaxID=88688 RepID=A0A2W5VAZ4_9CAUL|nr:hypothetical protein [Caulobacter segnis]PZR35797.1 MAG: hypothetical protein DI526_05780 [Caulobacter segnis]
MYVIENVTQYLRHVRTCLDRDHRRKTSKVLFAYSATGLFAVDLITVTLLPPSLPVVGLLHVLHTPMSAWAGFLGMLVVFCEEPRK